MKLLRFSISLITVALLALLAGCASKPTVPTPQDTLKAGMTDAAIEQAKQPLFKLTCPPAGCVISSLEVGNPNAAAAMADAMKNAFVTQPSDGVLMWSSFMDAVKVIGVPGLLINGAANIVGKITSAQTATASLIQAPQANITTSTSMVNSTGVLGSGSFSAPVSTTSNNIAGVGFVGSGTLTNNPITNSNNPVNPVPSVPRVCTVVAGVLTCSPP